MSWLEDHMDEETEWFLTTALSKSETSEQLPQPRDERPLKKKKEEEVVEKDVPLEIKVLLDNPGLDKEGLLDVLYSKRYREELLSTVELRMTSPDNVDYEPFVSFNVEILRELKNAISRLADGKKRLIEFEQVYGESWRHSICYPVSPESISSSKTPQLKGKLFIQRDEVEFSVLSGMHQGRCDVTSSNDMTACDVVSLLTSGRTLVRPGGERIVLEPDTFRSKYVLVFCVNAPVLYLSDGFLSLLNLCNELYSVMGDDIEMVMVARMNILADAEQVFKHLFSGFPTSCLAVPYEDWERRDRIWELLNRGVFKTPQCVVYDTNGMFLTSFCVDGSERPYGAEAFPFTEDMVQKVLTERLQLRKEGLEKLLMPYESSPDVVVYEFNSPLEQRRISEVIKDKHVGLYVCSEGSLIPRLHECKEKNREFEIVVLYLPFITYIETEIFKKKIDGLLQKENIHGWWCLPFNNSVSLRFWGLTMDYDCSDGDKWEDKLIVVGPTGNILDMYGAEAIRRADTYPFTRAAVVEQQMGRLRDLTLESLLVGQLFRGCQPSDTISAESLREKKIIVLMLHVPVNKYDYDFDRLVSQYNEMKEEEKEFEVVFVEFPYGRGVTSVEEFSAMPWYVLCPLDGTFTSLAERLREMQFVGSEALAGFGEDGRMLSVKILDEDLRRRPVTGKELCLDDTLEQDINQILSFDTCRDI